MFEGKNDNILFFILLKLPSFMTVLLKVQGAPPTLHSSITAEYLGYMKTSPTVKVSQYTHMAQCSDLHVLGPPPQQHHGLIRVALPPGHDLAGEGHLLLLAP